MLYFQGNGSIVWGRILEFSGKTETWWTEEKNKQLQERFHVTKNLTAVFIDSWSLVGDRSRRKPKVRPKILRIFLIKNSDFGKISEKNFSQ